MAWEDPLLRDEDHLYYYVFQSVLQQQTLLAHAFSTPGEFLDFSQNPDGRN